VIRFLTAAVVILLAGVAAVVSYRHAYEVVIANGESGFTAILVPLTIDGLIFASSMVLLDAARRRLPAPKLAYLTLGLGVVATLAANVMHGWAHGPVGAIVAAWPALALVLSYELLMGLIRRATKTVPAPVSEAAVPPIVAAAEEILAAAATVPETVDAPPVPAPAPAVPAQVAAAPTGDGETEDDDGRELVDAVQVQPDADAPYRPVAVAHFLAEVVTGEPPTVRTIKDRMNVGTDRARRLQAYLGGLVEVAQ
jgi:hypothetical protein